VIVPTVTELRLRVRSTDIDSQNIVNNAKYFEFFQDARLDHLAALRSETGPAPSFALVTTTCTYRSSLRHRDEIVIRAWTAEVRNRSFVFEYDIRRPDGALVAEGSSVQVWLDAEGQPTVPSDEVKAALERSRPISDS